MPGHQLAAHKPIFCRDLLVGAWAPLIQSQDGARAAINEAAKIETCFVEELDTARRDVQQPYLRTQGRRSRWVFQGSIQVAPRVHVRCSPPCWNNAWSYDCIDTS